MTSMHAGYVYWQTAHWLVEQGLAYYPSGSTWLALTAEGRKAAAEVCPDAKERRHARSDK